MSEPAQKMDPIVAPEVIFILNEPSSFESIKSYLEENNFPCHMFQDLQQGIFKAMSSEGSIIFISWNLQDTKVPSVVQLLAQKFNIHSVVFSEDEGVRSAAGLSSSGIKETIQRPFNKKNFLMCLRTILADRKKEDLKKERKERHQQRILKNIKVNEEKSQKRMQGSAVEPKTPGAGGNGPKKGDMPGAFESGRVNDSTFSKEVISVGNENEKEEPSGLKSINLSLGKSNKSEEKNSIRFDGAAPSSTLRQKPSGVDHRKKVPTMVQKGALSKGFSIVEVGSQGNQSKDFSIVKEGAKSKESTAIEGGSHSKGFSIVEEGAKSKESIAIDEGSQSTGFAIVEEGSKSKESIAIEEGTTNRRVSIVEEGASLNTDPILIGHEPIEMNGEIAQEIDLTTRSLLSQKTEEETKESSSPTTPKILDKKPVALKDESMGVEEDLPQTVTSVHEMGQIKTLGDAAGIHSQGEEIPFGEMLEGVEGGQRFPMRKGGGSLKDVVSPLTKGVEKKNEYEQEQEYVRASHSVSVEVDDELILFTRKHIWLMLVGVVVGGALSLIYLWQAFGKYLIILLKS